MLDRLVPTEKSVDFSALFTMSPENVKKNKTLAEPGLEIDYMYYLFDGFVAEQTIDRFNGITTHAIYGPGDLIDVRSKKTYKVSPPTYMTITDCRLMYQPAMDFFRKSTHDQLYGAALVKNLLYQLELSHERTENLTLKYAADRVIYRLLFFANRFGVKRNQGTEIQLPMTHRLLASTINLSRERASQVMYKLRQNGLIAYSGKRVTLLDVRALEHMLTPHEKFI